MKKSIFIVAALFVLAGCSLIKEDLSSEPEAAGMPNPASVYCEENGGKLDIREGEEGQYGACVFNDGSECEEWAFYRGECKPLSDTLSEDDAKQMASDYIMGMAEYAQGNGSHLEEIDTQILRCPGCYELKYEFRIREQDSADIIGTADVTITITDGEITKVAYWDDMTGEEKTLPIQESPLIGGQRDEYGCLDPAGYQWCEVTQKCQRFWEEPCVEDPEFSVADIEQAFLEKYPDWGKYNMEINVYKQIGNHASGGSKPVNADAGGGYFFAAKTDDGWVLAADGNGEIGCSEIEPYNFPSDMIPECWDDVNMVNVQR